MNSCLGENLWRYDEPATLRSATSPLPSLNTSSSTRATGSAYDKKVLEIHGVYAKTSFRDD